MHIYSINACEICILLMAWHRRQIDEQGVCHGTSHRPPSARNSASDDFLLQRCTEMHPTDSLPPSASSQGRPSAAGLKQDAAAKSGAAPQPWPAGRPLAAACLPLSPRVRKTLRFSPPPACDCRTALDRFTSVRPRRKPLSLLGVRRLPTLEALVIAERRRPRAPACGWLKTTCLGHCCCDGSAVSWAIGCGGSKATAESAESSWWSERTSTRFHRRAPSIVAQACSTKIVSIGSSRRSSCERGANLVGGSRFLDWVPVKHAVQNRTSCIATSLVEKAHHFAGAPLTTNLVVQGLSISKRSATILISISGPGAIDAGPTPHDRDAPPRDPPVQEQPGPEALRYESVGRRYFPSSNGLADGRNGAPSRQLTDVEDQHRRRAMVSHGGSMKQHADDASRLSGDGPQIEGRGSAPVHRHMHHASEGLPCRLPRHCHQSRRSPTFRWLGAS